eukprot:s115_g17.t1
MTMLPMPSKSFQSVLVHDSLPYGMDNGSTLPMEVSPGTIPSSVVEMLEGEENRVKDSADTQRANANATSKSSAPEIPQALTSERDSDVLTRRQQLGLAAEAKEDSKNGKGRGRGRGGKGRGKVRERPADATTIKPAEQENNNGEASTPRRKLFDDESDDKVSKGSAIASGMDVDPPASEPTEKKPAKRVRGKRAPAPPKVEEAPMTSSPPIKQKKKRAKGPKDAEGKQDMPEKVPPQGPAPSQPEPAEPATEKASKLPGKAKIKSSENALKEAQKDPATWHHVQKLWGALRTLKVSKGDLSSVPKFQYWSYSWYWKTNRVGLLTKSLGGKDVHRASFGGALCSSMSTPLQAALLYVVALVEYMGGDKPVEDLKSFEDETVEAYRVALQELVAAIGVADSLGKCLEDYEPSKKQAD